MGVLHNELPASNLGKAIRAALGVKEGEKTIERFGETLTPTIDLWGRPEFAKLREEHICGGFGSLAAGGAGFIAEMSLGNPTGSGKLIIVDFFKPLITPASAQIQFKIGIYADLGTSFNTAFRDLRIAVASATVKPVGTLTGKNGDATTHGFEIFRFNVSATILNSYQDFPPFVLPPGTAVFWNSITANETNSGNIGWRERRALAGELD